MLSGTHISIICRKESTAVSEFSKSYNGLILPVIKISHGENCFSIEGVMSVAFKLFFLIKAAYPLKSNFGILMGVYISFFSR